MLRTLRVRIPRAGFAFLAFLAMMLLLPMWWLYVFSRDGMPFGVLMTGDTATQPGQVLLSILLAPVESIGLATQIVQDTIGIVDRGSPLTGFVPTELEAALAVT